MYSPYQQLPQSRSDELKVVNGRASAEQYIMYPNSRVILLDSTMDRFYLKTTDATGMANIKVYDFTEVDDTPQLTNYITKQEVEELIRNELNSIKSTNDNNAATKF